MVPKFVKPLAVVSTLNGKYYGTNNLLLLVDTS